jgi:hypothetical protein
VRLMTVTATDRSVFRRDRFFYVGADQSLAAGWYVELREGVRGPFSTRLEAEDMLATVIRVHPRKRVSLWGGRG